MTAHGPDGSDSATPTTPPSTPVSATSTSASTPTSISDSNSTPARSERPAERPAERKGPSPIVDLVVNIALPAFILMRLSAPDRLGPVASFALALAIPFVYGIWSAVRERKVNLIAALGLVNILLSGGLRFLEVGRLGFAVKEALTPAIIGCVVLLSMRKETPFVRKMLYNEKIVNVETIDALLAASGRTRELDALLDRTTIILASSFFLSSVLNFALAWVLLVSPVGSQEFNEQLGRMTALSWPVIVVPSMAVMALALWHLGRGLRALTGLDWDGVLKGEPAAKKG